MTIGGGIALIIIGAILAYAVEYEFSGIDIRVVGVILMIGGLVGLAFGLIRMLSARSSSRRVVERPVDVHERRVYEERRDDPRI
ncbi:DUF6458 family protein [Actinomadura flavalba]|uniref:DUF6458 family protein n=1 Tax=Actinomadura flavalba TaxID=1120938 RepID=UPI00036EDA1A|nr:DUF6458 family protein [Actinomadura flavalba]